MSLAKALERRQLWGVPESTTTTTATDANCTPFTLPSNGVLSLADAAITLTTNVIFQPVCTDAPSNNSVSTAQDLRDPFYASTIPQTYVISAATVIAWILVVMLTITPRTSFFGGSLSSGFTSGRGIIGGASGGNTNLIGVGSRPWLQKAAALTVAISLTIATADTFRVARTQYISGYMDAGTLREEVFGSIEIRVTRVISDVFVWLAQVQTLIRLFPRHKEKVLIKWIGFALIIFDSLFSCLNAFLVNAPRSRPGKFADAIPALSYLFELALGLLYAAWVIYYAMTKRRYAFYHPKMRNIALIALLSLVAILTPVVFFVTDVLNQDVAGWGDYFRWVGATAASVVVWEWVERIEALENDEKRDGILGREVFDGDEMLESPRGEGMVWNSSRYNRFRKGGGDDDDPNGEKVKPSDGRGLDGFTQRFRQKPQAAQHFPLGRAHSATTATTLGQLNGTNSNRAIAFGSLPRRGGGQTPQGALGQPTPPPPVASPVNRAENTSGASTVYVVRYDGAEADDPQPIRRRPNANRQSRDQAPKDPEKEVNSDGEEEPQRTRARDQGKWHSVSNPFKRKRASPPAVVQKAAGQNSAPESTHAVTSAHNVRRWDLKKRIGALASETSDRFRERGGSRTDIDMPVTIIPAQARGSGRTWSPEISRQQQRQHATETSDPNPASQATSDTLVNGSSTNSGNNSNGTGQGNSNNSSNTPSPTSRAAHFPRRYTNEGENVHLHPSDAAGQQNTATTVVPAPSRSPGSVPPRADDLSPTAGGDPVVVPAPSRRSPLRLSTPASPNSPANARGSTRTGQS